MRITPPLLAIKETDGFKNDELARENYGKILTNLITKNTDPLVIAIDGKWGEGKTTFVKMWQGLLTQKNIPSIYIDAFANDHTDNAFIAIASAISGFVQNHIASNDAEKAKAFKENSKTIGVQLLSWSAQIALKAATLGAINSSDIEELSYIKNDISQGVSDVVSDFIEERLSNHQQEIENIENYKKLLASIPSSLEDSESRLIVIIDELDRCKPTFAVDIIERIKHLFSVPNVVFVLVMHKPQLEEAIKHVYGNGVDANTYLQKFISLEMHIPKQENSYTTTSSTYILKLINDYNLKLNNNTENNLYDFLEYFAQTCDLSLRQLEKVFTNISILTNTTRLIDRRIPLISFISVIKVISPDIFQRLLHGNISYQELTQYLTRVNILAIKTTNQNNLDWLLNSLKVTLLSEEEYEQLPATSPVKSLNNDAYEYTQNRKEIIPTLAQSLNVFNVR